MAYCTPSDVRLYLGVDGLGDDELLTALIARAQQVIDTHTHRTYQASSNSTRNFTVGEDNEGATLWFDEDICSITTVTTDADGGATVISSTEYVTLPRNETPYYAIRIKASSSNTWTYSTDPEGGITVAGKWGYSTSPPDDIVQACIRYSAYLYRQKDAQVFDVTAVPDAGVITVPQGIPKDVELLLEPYIKRVYQRVI